MRSSGRRAPALLATTLILAARFGKIAKDTNGSRSSRSARLQGFEGIEGELFSCRGIGHFRGARLDAAAV